MVNLFEIRDKNGRKIRLTYKQWKHIAGKHPEIVNPGSIKETIMNSLVINPSDSNPENVKWYYSFNKDRNRYLLVSVRYLNGEGFIITAYYTRSIQ